MRLGGLRVALTGSAPSPVATANAAVPTVPWAFETHGGPVFGFFSAGGYSSSLLLMRWKLLIDGAWVGPEARVYEDVANAHRPTTPALFGPAKLAPGAHIAQIQISSSPTSMDASDHISCMIFEVT